MLQKIYLLTRAVNFFFFSKSLTIGRGTGPEAGRGQQVAQSRLYLPVHSITLILPTPISGPKAMLISRLNCTGLYSNAFGTFKLHSAEIRNQRVLPCLLKVDAVHLFNEYFTIIKSYY